MRTILKSGNSILLMILSSVFINYSCTGRASGDTVSSLQPNPEIEEIDIDNAQRCDEFLFSSYFESPTVIALETNSNCIIRNIQAIDYYEERFYILDDEANALYVFSSDGSFIRTIGHEGNGHGEYMEISDFSIDREKGELYLWDEALDMALKYNINTGDYISSNRTKRGGERSYSMQYYKGRLYVNNTSADEDESHYLLREIDAETGQQLATYLNADEYNKGWNFPIRFPHTIFYSKNSDAPKFVEMFSDTIVSVTADGIVPSYVVRSHDFVTKEDIACMVKGTSDYLNIDMEALAERNRISHISRFTDLKDGVYFEYMHGDDNYYLFYDSLQGKATVSSRLINDYVAKDLNVPMNICYSDDSGILAFIMPSHMSYFINNVVRGGKLELDENSCSVLINLDEESNPILFYHEYRESGHLLPQCQ